MADLMTFPDTVEEFMEQYKMVDTEHLYSNGVEFVPIFRMRQWFQHEPERKTEIIRCKDCSRWCVCHHSDDWYCADAERRTDDLQ